MRFEAATTLDQAVALLAGAQGRARVLAGGTDLLVQIRSERADPDLIVDIKRIKGINQHRASERGWRIGAAVTCAELGEHAELRAEWPGVVEAAQLIGSTQVQGRATHSRQSLQRLAGGRQCPGDDRGRCQGRDRRP